VAETPTTEATETTEASEPASATTEAPTTVEPVVVAPVAVEAPPVEEAPVDKAAETPASTIAAVEKVRPPPFRLLSELDAHRTLCLFGSFSHNPSSVHHYELKPLVYGMRVNLMD
jgi:hypothetical protein